MPPAIRASHTPGSGSDLCEGWSPCDSFDSYWLSFSEPGANIISPGVNNHKPFSGTFVPGLGASAVGANDGQLQVYTCPIVGDYPPDDLSGLPPDVDCGGDGTDKFAGKFRWPDPVMGDELYATNLQFKLTGAAKKAETKPAFRIYLTAGDRHLAHRDIRLCTSEFSPADGSIFCTGTGNIPFKAFVGSDVGCKKFDSNSNTSENAGVCLIAGDLPGVTLNGQGGVSAVLNFGFQNPTDAFIAEFQLSECGSLNESMDLSFLGCKVTIDAPSTAELNNAAEIILTILDNEASVCFTDPKTPETDLPGCVMVLEDENGQQMLPLTALPDPPSVLSPLRNLLGAGLNRLAALVGAKPLVATAVGSKLSGGFRDLSDIQAAIRTFTGFPDGFGTDCGDACRDLGVVAGTETVTVQAVAPNPNGPVAVPGVRFHFFPDGGGGTAACPATLPAGALCFEPGEADVTVTSTPTNWSPQTVFITGTDGKASVEWTPGVGSNPREMKILVCGGAIDGSYTPQLVGNHPFVWGYLQTCDRDPADVDNGSDGYANGPLVGVDDPFEPINNTFGVAANDLPLTVRASSCPTPFVEDGLRYKDGKDQWPDDCVGKFDFFANTSGAQPDVENATLRWTNDGEYLYVAVEVRGARAKDLNDAFFIFDNNADGTEDDTYAADTELGDDIVVMRLGESPVTKDWWTTERCAGSPKASLCGSPDDAFRQDADGFAARSPTGDLFWEFRKKLMSVGCGVTGDQFGEDFCLEKGDFVASSGTITGGQGGGKGGTDFPDKGVFHLIQIK
jgi:hypothetical protein